MRRTVSCGPPFCTAHGTAPTESCTVPRGSVALKFRYIQNWRRITISELLINEQITFPEVRLVSEDGVQLGIMSSREALKKADEANLDLILIAPAAKPPVCRIMDYSKFRYEQTRRERDAKKKQKTVEVKEIRLSPNIDSNDLNTKSNNARKFLEKGNRVKVTLRFRGREMAHISQTKHVLEDFADTLADIASLDKAAKMEGRSMSIVLAPKAGK